MVLNSSHAASAVLHFGRNSGAYTSKAVFSFDFDGMSHNNSNGNRCWIGLSRYDFPARNRTPRTTLSRPWISFHNTNSPYTSVLFFTFDHYDISRFQRHFFAVMFQVMTFSGI
jgi:hypothetical protein